jgi:2,5-diketo-D-gluconate reductase A
MPALGVGVFQSSPEETAGAVESALSQGYRLIDTAAAYFNERQVGDGLRRAGIPRDDVFVETKVWISDYSTTPFDVFDFELSKDQLAAIDALDTGVRRGPEPDSITLETYGREIPEA